jgi:hypothetical protein
MLSTHRRLLAMIVQDAPGLPDRTISNPNSISQEPINLTALAD